MIKSTPSVDHSLIEVISNEPRLRDVLAAVAAVPFGIGRSLIEAAAAHGVTVATDPDVRGGKYFRSDDGATQACTVDPQMEAGTVAHELRHSWQANMLAPSLCWPEAPGEMLAGLRMREADARAVGGYVNMAVWSAQGMAHEEALGQCRTIADRVAVQTYYDMMPDIMGDRRQTGRVLRHLFEDALSTLPESYFYEGVFAAEMVRRHEEPVLPAFARGVDDPAAMVRIARALGRVGDGDNYVAGRADMAVSCAGPGVLTGPVLQRLRGAVFKA